jgi:hypothetical protein
MPSVPVVQLYIYAECGGSYEYTKGAVLKKRSGEGNYQCHTFVGII